MLVALIVLIGLVGGVVCWVWGWRVARSIRRTLEGLEAVVERLAAGEQDARAVVDGPAEIQRLSRAVNEMAEQNARQSLRVARTAHLLELGHLIESGPAAEIAAKESVQAVFLGGQA